MLIAQITDSHIKAEGQLAYQKVDTEKNLRRCVEHLLNLKPRPDVVLATGDLTDFGRPEEFALFRRLVEPLAMPLYLIPGNHDSREGIREALKDYHYLPKHGEFLHYAIDDYPLRLIGLDTTIPNRPQGILCAKRLDWLDQQLRKKPGTPTVLFMHHPPIEVGIDHMDAQNCGNSAAFGDLLEQHPQVIQLLCGHVHRPVHTQWRGVTVTIAPSSSHYVALDLSQNASADFVLEPPSVQLHRWRADQGLTSHLSFIGTFDGPHPFYDAQGRLID